jgi:hypothetical protein
MLIVGEKTLYLSHLPMFQEKNARPMPHRYQVLLEVSLGRQGDGSQDQYAEDRRNHPDKIYTVNPEEFVLPTIAATDPQQVRRSFKAHLFRGHLEKLEDGEDTLLKNVEVTIKQVVHFRQFDAGGKKAARLEYLLFGKGKELFLAHRITAPPDFDQILSIESMDISFTDEELQKGVVVIFPGTTNAAGKRLKAEGSVTGEVKKGPSSAVKKVKIVLNRELYFEEGELRVPPVFDTTAEEKKSGFQ